MCNYTGFKLMQTDWLIEFRTQKRDAIVSHLKITCPTISLVIFPLMSDKLLCFILVSSRYIKFPIEGLKF